MEGIAISRAIGCYNNRVIAMSFGDDLFLCYDDFAANFAVRAFCETVCGAGGFHGCVNNFRVAQRRYGLGADNFTAITGDDHGACLGAGGISCDGGGVYMAGSGNSIALIAVSADSAGIGGVTGLGTGGGGNCSAVVMSQRLYCLLRSQNSIADRAVGAFRETTLSTACRNCCICNHSVTLRRNRFGIAIDANSACVDSRTGFRTGSRSCRRRIAVRMAGLGNINLKG